MAKKNKKKGSPFTARQTPFAKKSFGQNFLVDQHYIDKIISALSPQKHETIIEIGAGRGALTERLIEKAGKVIAIELDRDLIPFLTEKFGQFENFEIIESDALHVDFKDLIGKLQPSKHAVKLVANLPYNISTAILQRLIEQREIFSELILMFQREVVERITARPGNSERGFLTVLAEAYMDTNKLFDVSPNAFLPVPKVWSSIVRLTPKRDVEIGNEELFREVVSAAFRQKRKTILNNLKNASVDLSEKFEKRGIQSILENSDIAPDRRAETLTSEEWMRLINQLV